MVGGSVVFGILWCGEMVLFVTVGVMDLSGGIVWKLYGNCALLTAVLFLLAMSNDG